MLVARNIYYSESLGVSPTRELGNTQATQTYSAHSDKMHAYETKQNCTTRSPMIAMSTRSKKADAATSFALSRQKMNLLTVKTADELVTTVDETSRQ